MLDDVDVDRAQAGGVVSVSSVDGEPHRTSSWPRRRSALVQRPWSEGLFRRSCHAKGDGDDDSVATASRRRSRSSRIRIYDFGGGGFLTFPSGPISFPSDIVASFTSQRLRPDCQPRSVAHLQAGTNESLASFPRQDSSTSARRRHRTRRRSPLPAAAPPVRSRR